MITWKANLDVALVKQRYRWGIVRLSVVFAVFDDDDPGTILHRRREVFDWPLNAFVGLSLGQIANLVLNVGRIVPNPDPPPPGVPPEEWPDEIGPDPPPLREVGAGIAGDYGRVATPLNLPLPHVFGV